MASICIKFGLAVLMTFFIMYVGCFIEIKGTKYTFTPALISNKDFNYNLHVKQVVADSGGSKSVSTKPSNSKSSRRFVKSDIEEQILRPNKASDKTVTQNDERISTSISSTGISQKSGELKFKKERHDGGIYLKPRDSKVSYIRNSHSSLENKTKKYFLEALESGLDDLSLKNKLDDGKTDILDGSQEDIDKDMDPITTEIYPDTTYDLTTETPPTESPVTVEGMQRIEIRSGPLDTGMPGETSQM